MIYPFAHVPDLVFQGKRVYGLIAVALVTGINRFAHFDAFVMRIEYVRNGKSQTNALYLVGNIKSEFEKWVCIHLVQLYFRLEIQIVSDIQILPNLILRLVGQIKTLVSFVVEGT